MDKSTFLRVDFELLTHSSTLGDGVDLPYSEELKNALNLVSNATEIEVKRRHTFARNMWLADMYQKIRENNGNTQVIMKLLNEIADYEKPGNKK